MSPSFRLIRAPCVVQLSYQKDILPSPGIQNICSSNSVLTLHKAFQKSDCLGFYFAATGIKAYNNKSLHDRLSTLEDAMKEIRKMHEFFVVQQSHVHLRNHLYQLIDDKYFFLLTRNGSSREV